MREFPKWRDVLWYSIGFWGVILAGVLLYFFNY